MRSRRGIDKHTLDTCSSQSTQHTRNSIQATQHIVDVGCYAPAARTTLTPCVFSRVHPPPPSSRLTTGCAPQLTLSKSFGVRRVHSATRLENFLSDIWRAR